MLLQRVAAGSRVQTASMVAFLMHSPLNLNPFRTSMLTGMKSLLKGILLCLSISSSLATDIVVKYPKSIITKQEGEALNLNCTIVFDQHHCSNLNANWCKFDLNNSCIELTDTKGYLIQVSEMTLEPSAVRSRLITISFEQLTPRDKGKFQCNAECGGNGLSARGNYIDLLIKKADPNRNSQKNCGIQKVEIIPVALHFLSLFVSTALCLY